jgi:L-alanine-DL-glutamate epimerase-like enolase superfamily enzyme
MYFVPGHDDINLMVERAQAAVARGFGTIYFKIGIDEERDIELVRQTREAIGHGPKIRVDANEAWSPGTAVRILRRMASSVIEYIEQPTLMHDIEGLAHVRRPTRDPRNRSTGRRRRDHDGRAPRRWTNADEEGAGAL